MEDLTIIPLEVSTSEFSRQQQEISEKDAKCKKLALENAILNEKLSQVTAENKELNESIEELDKQHELAIDEVLQARNILQEKYNSVLKKVESVHLLDGELNDLKKEYVLSCEENARLKHSVIELNEELNKVVSENVENITKFEIEIHHLKKEEETFEKQIETLQHELQKTKIIEKELNTIKAQYESLLKIEEDYDRVQKELVEMKSRNDEEIVTLQNVESDFEGQIKEKDNIIENITLER